MHRPEAARVSAQPSSRALAAIVRQPGAAPVAWHSDFCGHFPLPPLNTGHVLLRSERVPSGIWFYLSGSHPRRGGLAVIEDSHRYVAGSFGSGQS